MADIVAKLQVDSSQYDQKLKSAISQMTKMEQEVRRTGASFAYADKEEMAFVQSLGNMSTQASSAKSKLREYTDAIMSLTSTYRQMTDEEKNSDYGKALAQSIDKIKIKAAELKDVMSDTNREIQNLASDTSFTEGISMMTRTIGASASAIVAWTGDSKEMEAVIKDLAKIGTTVAAVEQLTKAFQKQNLVLLKNPYVAVAAAAVALAVALGKIIKSTTELSETQKALNEVQQKGMENSAQEVTRIEALNNILHDNTRSLDDRKAALNEIQALVPDYHGALTEEGNLINDNADVIKGYVKELQRAAAAQAAFDKMVEVQKRKLANQLELQKAQGDLNRAQSMQSAGAPAGVATGGAGAISFQGANAGARQSDVRAAQSAVDKIQKRIDEDDEVIKNLGKLVDANTLGSGTNTTRTTGGNRRGSGGSRSRGTGGGATIKPEEVLPEGSIAAVEKRISELQDKFSKATTQEAREAINADIVALEEQLKGMRIEPKVEIPEGSMAALNNQLSELQKAWDLAADDESRAEIGKQIDEVTEKIKKMNGEVAKVTTASDMWSEHTDKLKEVQDRLAEFRAMMVDMSLSQDQRDWAAGMAKSYKEQLDEMLGLTHKAAAEMEDTWKTSMDNINSGISAISTIGNAFDNIKGSVEDLQEAFSGEMDAWDALMTVFNSGISIMQTVMGVMEAINTLKELSAALSEKRAIAEATEATATTTAASTEVAAESEKMAASSAATATNTAEAASGAGKAMSAIPIVGPILAVAAIAAVLAAIMSAKSKAKDAGKFAQGGVVGGNSYSGDRLMAYVNSGETILTPSQADKAMAGIQGNPMSNMRLSTEIDGKKLRIVLNNDNRAEGGSRDFYSKLH